MRTQFIFLTVCIVVLNVFLPAATSAQRLPHRAFGGLDTLVPDYSLRTEPTDLASTFDHLISKARSAGTVPIIVGFQLDGYRPDAAISGSEQRAQRKRISEMQSSLIDRAATLGVTNVKRFTYIPFFAINAEASALEELRRSPEIVSIQEDLEQHASLLQSIPLIGAVTAWNAGFTGQGRTVAVLDTGVDKFHPFFNGRVVSEACYSTNSGNTTSLCPGGVSQSIASNSGLNCNVSVIEGCFHGTHVAGITAGGNPQINGAGVARNANIIAIQVFSASTSCDPNPAPCTTAFTSDTILGLERVYALRTTYTIDAVNLSLGGGRYFNQCDTEQAAYKAVVDTLRGAGIATIVASGNDGHTDSVSSPACVSTAVSVGSTHDGDAGFVDTVSDFSNSAYFLNLLAPGELITSAYPGGFYYDTQGTSMAAPHVAGAWAVVKQKFPSDSVTQVLTRFRYSGLQAFDNRNALTKPRIKLDAALNASNVDPCGSVSSINIGTPVNASLSSADCLLALGNRTDIYSFNGTAGQGVAITQTSASFDTYLYLLNSSGQVIGQDNNGGGGTNSRVPAGSGFINLPASGTYYVYATSFNGNVFGNYSVTLTSNSAGTPTARPFDYDGDGRADISVYRPSTGAWYLSRSTAGFFGLLFGNSTDRLAPADYDGDGKIDLAVYRPSTGVWYVVNSSNGAVNYTVFGIAEDKPTPADYDGDGRADISVFRPSSGTWYRLNSSNGGFVAVQFGQNGDKPTMGDFDGDRKADIAVFRPSTGAWYQTYSSSGFLFGEQFGVSTDKIAPADYDGDNKTDIAIYRPSAGLWYVKNSSTTTYVPYVFGLSTDIPVPGHFDGDGRADIGVFRPSNGTWYIVNSTSGGFTTVQFGQNGDNPTENAFNN